MKRKIIIVLLMLLSITLIIKKPNISADTVNYYYDQLNDNAKKFYNCFVKMEEEGIFKTNQSYDLIKNNIISEKEIKQLLSGNNQILKDFAAGKDAYYLEHPNNFYVDFSKLELSIKQQNNTYLAYIDAGRNESYLYEGIEQNKLDSMIEQYNNVLKNIKTELEKKTSKYEQIKLINKLISERTTYDFNGDGTKLMQNQIRTSYGALINGYAVCEGYARTFKTLLDLVNIQSVTIIGYYHDENNVEPHAWCYVLLDSKWYLVDPTYNDNTTNIEQYLLLGSSNTTLYEESETISNGGFNFKYPTLATYDYGKEEIKTIISYDKSSDPAYQKINYQYQKYQNASELQKDNLYLIMRHEYFDNNDATIKTAAYFSLYDYPLDYVELNHSVFSTEFAITTQKPDITETYYGMYNKIDEEKIIAKSDKIYNEIYNENANTPKVLSITPSPTTILDANEKYQITIKYNATISKADETKEIKIFVYNEKSKNLNEYVKCENITLKKDSITFDFTPSKMYEHDMLDYRFILNNVVGTNGSAPVCASLKFASPWQVCSKIFNDERLYIDAYASPTLIDTKDLSMDGFVVDGKHVSENERSQLALVVTKPTKNETEIMKENVENLITKDILSSATYNLDLHICGGVTKIPNGSYVKLAFGFPEGYGPNDEDVTFKVYHFKKDENGNIDQTKTEEVECVVTQYGIVVTVSSFSPFMIVATNEKTTKKNIYSRVVTGNGTISSDLSKNLNIVSLNEGFVTYQFTPNKNYQLDYVLLNNKELEVKDNQIKIYYEDLKDNNELIVSFVADSIYEIEKQNNLTSINKNILMAKQITSTKSNNKKYIIIGTGIILIIAGLSTIFIKRKRGKNE